MSRSPATSATVRQDGWESSKVSRVVPAAVTRTSLNPLRGGAHQPRVEDRVARSTEARQYARPGPMVACASVPSPSAHVPPVVVGTSEPPSTENLLPLSRSMTVATFGLVSSSSAATTTAYLPSMSVSVMRYWFGALIVAGLGPSSSALVARWG